MKVFTVGLDQKPVEENKEKTDSPPPGYSTSETRIPLPMGPELPRPSLQIPPPQPIIVRKSRGYKGILLVMLSVFLMAIFALVLSEMAYSRQRDENFFKLRWAELKQRFGYDNDGQIDYYSQAANAISDKLLSLSKSNDLQVPRVIPLSLSVEEDTSSSSSTTQESPVVAIDTFPIFPSKIGNSDSSSSSSSRSSSQTSSEIEQPQQHPLFASNNLNGALNQIRDARFKFLRNILQKIKQHAEDIGFDGTMQVSIVEVEPQNSDSSSTSNEDNNNNIFNNKNWPSSIFQQQRPQQQQILQFPSSSSAHFFPHPRPLVEDFKNSRSFLDGFGEMHQPSSSSLFMQNNQIGDQEEQQQQQRPRFFSPWALQNELPSSNSIMPSPEIQQQQQIPSFIDNLRWPKINGFRQSSPELLFFHPFFQQQQQQQMNMRFPPPPPPSSDWAHPQQNNLGFGGNGGALPRPSSFEHWNNAVPQQNFPQQQQQLPQSMGMFGNRPVEQQVIQQQPIQQQQNIPQQQQQPEIKLSAPSLVIGDSNDGKSPIVTPQQPGQQPQQSKQSEQQQKESSSWMTPDLLPNWLFDSISSSHKSDVASGPPSSQQQPAEIAPPKFPSVTVIDKDNNSPSSSSGSNSGSNSKSIADNEGNSRSEEIDNTPNRPSSDALPVETSKIIDNARGEIGKINNKDDKDDDKDDNKDDNIGTGHQPEEVIEVDAAPQLSEQQQPEQQNNNNNEQKNEEQNKEIKDLTKEQKNVDDKIDVKPVNVPLQQQKFFPEMPSVFFQVDDPASSNDQQAAPNQPAQDSSFRLAEGA